MSSEQYRELAREVIKYFLTSVKHLYDFTELEKAASSCKELESTALAFKTNLEAVVATASIPFTLAAASTYNQRLSHLIMSNRLRIKADALEAGEQDLEDPFSPDQEQSARKQAEAELEKELATESGAEEYRTNIIQLLLGVRRLSKFEGAAEELLRQATVLTWSACEVLARDTFVVLLNQKPVLTMDLLNDQNAKKLFAMKELNYELLASYNFDLSHRMGEVFRTANPLTSLTAIRTAYKALLPADTTLVEALQSPTLWLLSKRRHLIVHQRARVDQEYVDTTQDSLPLGSLLQISPMDLESYIGCVRNTGCLLVAAAAKQFTT